MIYMSIQQKTYSKKKHTWSQKYKKSINCNHPRGFSQRQYCKYGRRKTIKSNKTNKTIKSI